MEKGKQNQEEREEEKANKSSVSFSALRKDVIHPENLKGTLMERSNLQVSFSALRKDVANVLDFMERLKNEEDQKAVGVDLIEKLTFICTYVQLSYSDFEQFEDIMTRKTQEVEQRSRCCKISQEAS
ncbi:hypothetical protein MTR67_025280 [Solanum verrucosum]|uniref:Uncharacterized protein n=1 Tax=Solanum verrucosum TaxID=315347 RepID=A0AAF0QZX4_SOLVR|nr:hypothetical protein MTR67_025280 [Solanum verrucosum]